MKKVCTLLVIMLMFIALTACGGVTHCKDCDDKVYKDGYCQYHYALHSIDDTAKSAFDSLFGD